MIDLDAIAERLAAQVSVLRSTGTARDFGALTRGSIVWPSAYVVPLAESAGDTRYETDALVDQRVVEQFGVILAVRDIGPDRGGRALTGLRAVRAGILASLATFVPAGADTGCIPRSGRLLGGIDPQGGMFWQDDFHVAFNRRFISS